MIVVCIGKKGSGKTALLRKLAWRAVAARRAVFWHDPQAQIHPCEGSRVYLSIDEWVSDTRPAWLSIFRECDIDSVAALALKVRGVTLVADELDRACAGKRWLSPAVQRIVHEGRHFRVSLMGGFRRTANVSEDLLSQVDYAFLFRLSGASPADLDTVKRRFGEGFADAAMDLRPGETVLWTD